MKIHRALRRDDDRPLALAIGFFDGMHLGHRAIARATMRMRAPRWRSGVLTFENHPATFLRPQSAPELLTTPEERLDLLAVAGFEECFFVPFDEHIARMTPQAFLDALLSLDVRGVAVGDTFRFGHARAGDVALMRERLAGEGVEVAAVPSVVFEGARVSSTQIRKLVASGDLERAERMLGYGYELRGIVELGAGRGHALGFPTANLRVSEKLLPKDGVYAGIARYDGRDYATLVSIGMNPQFGGEARSVEAWLRDFRGTMYGRELALRDLRYVRDQRVFTSVEELIAQMRRDLDAVPYPSFV